MRCQECGDLILKNFYNPNCKSCILRKLEKMAKALNIEIIK